MNFKASIIFSILYISFFSSSAQDTTIVFPDGMSLNLKKNSKNKGTFLIDRKQLKTLNRQIDFLRNSLQLHENTEQLYQRNEVIVDSINSLNHQKIEIEQKKTESYKKGFEDLKEVNNQYNIQLESCKTDLINCATDLKKSNRKKLWSGLKGVAIGIAAGTLVGILITR